MTRTILLAPGDIIKKVYPELKDRNIKFEVSDVQEGSLETQTNNEEGEKTKGLDRKENAPISDRTETPSSISNENAPGHDLQNEPAHKGDSSIRTKDSGNKSDLGDRKTDLGRRDGHPDDKGRKLMNKELDDKSNDKIEEIEGNKKNQDKVAEKYCVCVQGIADAIKARIGVDVCVGEVNLVFLNRSLINELHVSEEDKNLQNDRLRELKKKNKNIKVKNVSSITVLKEIFGEGDNDIGPRIQSRVGLVTNKAEYVNKATVLFTAPTGDVNWKNVAAEATKKSNIVCHVYEVDDQQPELTAERALIALIDHL
nr:VP6 [Letea virus]